MPKISFKFNEKWLNDFRQRSSEQGAAALKAIIEYASTETLPVDKTIQAIIIPWIKCECCDADAASGFMYYHKHFKCFQNAHISDKEYIDLHTAILRYYKNGELPTFDNHWVADAFEIFKTFSDKKLQVPSEEDEANEREDYLERKTAKPLTNKSFLMTRPIKQNVEYFLHGANMRNDVKVKALRRKFGHTGYTVWCYLLETLTDANGFELNFNDVSIELWAADYDVTPELLREIIDYCCLIGLLQCNDDKTRVWGVGF